MDAALLIARLVVAATFAVAACAKLADRSGTLEAVRGFGALESLVRPIASILPFAELAAAVLLIPSATARAGAVLALVLLLAFSAAIARSMARGEAPDCHCFGQLHSEPAGPRTLIRNLVVAALAGFVVVGGAGTSATRWIAGLSDAGVVALIGGLVLVVLATVAGAIVLALLRRHGEVLLRLDALEQALVERGIVVATMPEAPPAGLPNGTPAPEFELPSLDGERVTLTGLLARERPVMLLFTDPGCGPCSALMPQLAAWQSEFAEALAIVPVSRGDRDANVAHAGEHGVTDVLLQSDREVSDLYDVAGTPGAVLIAPDGTIASPVQAGADAITSLVASALSPTLPVHHHQPTVGRPAPDATLLTLDGQERRLTMLLDGPTAVLFWSPTCGFCERMLPELRELEATAPAGAPKLLLISSGDAESNRAMGLRAPIVLDQSFAAGSAFGANGTPSAVLVDAEHRIASELVVGARAVLALAGAPAARA
jgi:thiol-disulfide isomerase/thioredoxin